MKVDFFIDTTFMATPTHTRTHNGKPDELELMCGRESPADPRRQKSAAPINLPVNPILLLSSAF